LVVVETIFGIILWNDREINCAPAGGRRHLRHFRTMQSAIAYEKLTRAAISPSHWPLKFPAC
jgi:hypothetical protein